MTGLHGDDTYRYVKDRNSAYHESNLVREHIHPR